MGFGPVANALALDFSASRRNQDPEQKQRILILGEASKLCTLEDPTSEEFGAKFENYGGQLVPTGLKTQEAQALRNWKERDKGESDKR